MLAHQRLAGLAALTLEAIQKTMMTELIYLRLLYVAIDGERRVTYQPHITYNYPQVRLVYCIITDNLFFIWDDNTCHNTSMVYEACSKVRRTGGYRIPVECARQVVMFMLSAPTKPASPDCGPPTYHFILVSYWRMLKDTEISLWASICSERSSIML